MYITKVARLSGRVGNAWRLTHRPCSGGEVMDLGISLPTSSPFASPEAIIRIAQEAERLGYAVVWTYERLLYALGDIPQPGGPPRPLPEVYKSVYEPADTLTWVAAQTSTIKLGTSVLDAPFRNPVPAGTPPGHSRPPQRRQGHRRVRSGLDGRGVRRRRGLQGASAPAGPPQRGPWTAHFAVAERTRSSSPLSGSGGPTRSPSTAASTASPT